MQLFFAKVLRSANEDEVRGLFSQFGRVIEVNLFRAFQVRTCSLLQGSRPDVATADNFSKHVPTWQHCSVNQHVLYAVGGALWLMGTNSNYRVVCCHRAGFLAACLHVLDTFRVQQHKCASGAHVG